jgi:hypothetical protein
MKQEYMQKLKSNYLTETGHMFGTVVNLESISRGVDISETIENFLNEDSDNKFKIELLMFPNWASKSKVYKVFKEPFTHIRIKKDF